MQPLRVMLSRWRPAATPAADPLSKVTAAWPHIVGDEIAAHSCVRAISNGTLIVTADSSAWSQQLAFLSERVLEGVAREAGVHVERIRFRTATSRITQPPWTRAKGHPVRAVPAAREPAATPADALERFRRRVLEAQRAKAAAGWGVCVGCGISIAPGARECTACANTQAQQRFAKTARLLFEAPWLRYAGVAPLVEALRPSEYEEIRRRLLAQWWDVLVRLRLQRRMPTARERSIASSFVLLKSGLDPDRIAPAVVRDLLGDELHDILYANRLKPASMKGTFVQ